MVTPARYRGMRAHPGLTQVGAARLLAVDDRTSRHWAQKGLCDGPADILLRLLLAQRITRANGGEVMSLLVEIAIKAGGRR
jgi:hypothetical protein